MIASLDSPHARRLSDRRTLIALLAGHFAILIALPEDARFTIRHDPAYADEPVSVSWYAMDTISLREALGVLVADANLRARKTPPDLVLERR